LWFLFIPRGRISNMNRGPDIRRGKRGGEVRSLSHLTPSASRGLQERGLTDERRGKRGGGKTGGKVLSFTVYSFLVIEEIELV